MARKPTGGKVGQKPYVPTPADRNTVTNMAAAGIKQDRIAACLGTDGISTATLTKYFRRELDVSMDMANATIASTLFQQAKAGNTTAMIFWLKTRARWREQHQVSLIGGDEDDPAIQQSVVVEYLDPPPLPEGEE